MTSQWSRDIDSNNGIYDQISAICSSSSSLSGNGRDLNCREIQSGEGAPGNLGQEIEDVNVLPSIGFLFFMYI